MSQTLTIEISDDTYTRLRREADASGKSPVGLAIAALERIYGNGSSELEKPRGDLRHHFGAYHSGKPSGADNEQIDADLAREYGDDHETA